MSVPSGTSPRASRLAVTAFVLAVLFFIPLVPLVGSVLGIIALVRLTNQPGVGGRGLAIAAIPVGFGSTFVAGILAAIAIPAFVSYQERAIDSEARVFIADIADAQLRYYESHDSFVEAGPTPESVPDELATAHFDGPWEDLAGLPATDAVRFQYEAVRETTADGQEAVAIRARGRRPGDREVVWEQVVTPDGAGELVRAPPP